MSGLVAQQLQHGDVGDTRRLRDVPERMPVVAGCLDRGAVFLHDGSAPFGDALHAGEGVHLQQRVGAGEQFLCLCDPSLILHPQGLVDEVVGERHGVVRVLVDVLLCAGVQRVCGGLLDLHAGNLAYRCGVVKGAM